jgi:L-ascorbate metabolism protein UlaG (beta-lactamase superfamily)
MFSIIISVFILTSTWDFSYALKSIAFKYLESNSWLLKYGSALSVAIDPVLQGNLDFGIPVLYSGQRKVINGEEELSNIAKNANYVLISQGFDDHAHSPTLRKLRQLQPAMSYICPPSAIPILKACDIQEYNIKSISPGETLRIAGQGTTLDIRATTGALLGPPWQAKENGYIISSKDFPSVYYEPHCMYDEDELKNLQADIVITPIVAQRLPAYTLVDGDLKALNLCKVLKSKFVLPMANGELTQSGILSKLLITEGAEGADVFVELLKSSPIVTQYVPAKAGTVVQVGSSFSLAN